VCDFEDAEERDLDVFAVFVRFNEMVGKDSLGEVSVCTVRVELRRLMSALVSDNNDFILGLSDVGPECGETYALGGSDDLLALIDGRELAGQPKSPFDMVIDLDLSRPKVDHRACPFFRGELPVPSDSGVEVSVRDESTGISRVEERF
jgi:hypothetical protein